MRNYREIWRYWDNHQDKKSDKPNEVTSCPDFCPDELLPAVIAGTLELTSSSQKSDNLYSYAQLVASSDLHTIIKSVIEESELPTPEKQQKLNKMFDKNVQSKQKVCLKTFKLMDIEQQIHSILSDLFLNPSSPKLFSLPILSDQISAIFSSLLFEIEFQRELVEALLCLPDYASSTLVVVKHVLLVSLAVHKSSLFSLCEVKSGNLENSDLKSPKIRRKSNSGIKPRSFPQNSENIQPITLLELIITRNCMHRTSFLKAMISLDQELLTPFIINTLQNEKIVFEVITEIKEDRVFMETLKSILLHSDIIENMKSSVVGCWFPVRVTERVDRYLEHAKYGDYELCLVVGCLLHVNGIPFDNSALKSISLENDKEVLKGGGLKFEQKYVKSDKKPKKSAQKPKKSKKSKINDDSVMCLDDTVEITSESDSSDPELTEPDLIMEPEISEPTTPDSQLTEESELDTEKVILSLTASVICEIVPSINEEDSILFLWRLFIDRLKDTVTENFKKSAEDAEHDPEKEAFVEMILLIAIYLSQDDRKKVVRILLQNPVVVKTGLSAVLRRHVNLGRKSLIIKPTQVKNLANLFSKNFYSEALAEYAICLPVTKNLTSETMSGNSFDILPADLVIEVLQERQNLNKETTGWVFEQIVHAGFFGK